MPSPGKQDQSEVVAFAKPFISKFHPSFEYYTHSNPWSYSPMVAGSHVYIPVMMSKGEPMEAQDT